MRIPATTGEPVEIVPISVTFQIGSIWRINFWWNRAAFSSVNGFSFIYLSIYSFFFAADLNFRCDVAARNDVVKMPSPISLYYNNNYLFFFRGWNIFIRIISETNNNNNNNKVGFFFVQLLVSKHSPIKTPKFPPNRFEELEHPSDFPFDGFKLVNRFTFHLVSHFCFFLFSFV